VVLGYDTVWGSEGRPDWMVLSRSYPFVNAASNELVDIIAERHRAARAAEERNVRTESTAAP